jgi:hypothetical protein
MKFLIDHNLRGHAVILLGSLTASGWLDLISIQFVLFEELTNFYSINQSAPIIEY